MLTSTIYFDKIIITKNIDKEMYVKMKSRKFKAVLAAVSAIAVLATAMTGFAAPTINSVTTYNLSTTKASVTTTVSGLVDQTAEVTLLVKTAVATDGVNGSGIAYIDQKPATGGSAAFTYQLDKAALGNATTAVVTSGNDANEGTATGNLGVAALADVDGATYTIDYTETAYGSGDLKVHATVAAKPDYEITDIKVNGVSQGKEATALEVAPADVITVETKLSYVTPTVSDRAENLEVVNYGDGKVGTPTVFKANGDWTEAGVSYKGYDFPAVEQAGQDYIVVILKGAEAIDASAITPYAR